MNQIAGILRAWGRNVSSGQLELLERFAGWLVTEAIPAGGLGTDESTRIGERHLLDSLSFLNGMPAGVPSSVLDAGSGVGLPGIPLAIFLPDSEVTLLDRSGRRVRLARRAVRILGLDNVRVEQGPIAARSTEVLTMRAVMEPKRAIDTVGQFFVEAHAVIAVTRGERPAGFEHIDCATHRVRIVDGGRGILDPAPWLLIMVPS